LSFVTLSGNSSLKLLAMTAATLYSRLIIIYSSSVSNRTPL